MVAIGGPNSAFQLVCNVLTALQQTSRQGIHKSGTVRKRVMNTHNTISYCTTTRYYFMHTRILTLSCYTLLHPTIFFLHAPSHIPRNPLRWYEEQQPETKR